MSRISELIEDPRSLSEQEEDAREIQEHYRRPPSIRTGDATCRTDVMYLLAKRLQGEAEAFIKWCDEIGEGGYHEGEKFERVAERMAGVEGVEFTDAMARAISEFQIVNGTGPE